MPPQVAVQSLPVAGCCRVPYPKVSCQHRYGHGAFHGGPNTGLVASTRRHGHELQHQVIKGSRSAIVCQAGLFGGLFGGRSGKKSKAGCGTCKGKGSITCPGCKGSGRNKANGNMFERWKCYDCQGFGLVTCPACGKEGKGLTPEQRGER